MKVLVTGSSGFVGRHFANYYNANGDEVVGVDIKEGDDCRDFFKDSDVQFDVVIHCAAVVGGRTMIEGSPFQLAAEDLSIDADMWRWAIRTRPGKIVYFSSSAAYPIELQERGAVEHNLHEWDIDYTKPRVPDATYGWVKLMGEMMAAEARKTGLKVFVFRPFSGYGSDQDLDYPFPSIMRRAVRREDPLVVWSDAVRDFIHIDNIVLGVVYALEYDLGYDALNLCTGVGVSFPQLARMAANAVGYDPKIQILEGKPKGVHRRVGNPGQSGFLIRHQISVADGVKRVINDYQNEGVGSEQGSS